MLTKASVLLLMWFRHAALDGLSHESTGTGEPLPSISGVTAGILAGPALGNLEFT